MGISVPLSAGFLWGKNKASRELESLGGGFRIVTPCQVVSELAETDSTEFHAEPFLIAQEYQGPWLGGTWSEEAGWEPKPIELSCGGESVPLRIENQEIVFPIEESISALEFRGVRQWGKLVGFLNDENASLALYFPLKEPLAEGHSSHEPIDFPQVILDGPGGIFASVFELNGQWYFFDGSTLLPAWPHRERGLFDLHGNYIERLHEVEMKEFQITSTTPGGVRTNYPTWVPIETETRGVLRYSPALPKRTESALVVIDPSVTQAFDERYVALLTQFLNREGLSVISLASGNSNASSQDFFASAQALLEEEARHQMTPKIGVGFRQPVDEAMLGISLDGHLVFDAQVASVNHEKPLLTVYRSQEERYGFPALNMSIELAGVDELYRRNVEQQSAVLGSSFEIDRTFLLALRNWFRLIAYPEKKEGEDKSAKEQISRERKEQS